MRPAGVFLCQKFTEMIKWKSTTTHHAARLALGLTNDEYCLLDWVYHTQGNEVYGKEGWCEIPYQDIADLIGMSKGGAFQMVDRMEKRGFIEVNPANTKRKRVTAKFSLPVYFDVKQDEEVGVTIVQKVNAHRSESERNRSESERQIKVNKDKIEVNNSLSIGDDKKLQWQDASEERVSNALHQIADYLKANPSRWSEIKDEARVKMERAEFWDNVKAWIRWNADNWPVIQHPVKALTSGRSNFVGWLMGERKRALVKAATSQQEPKLNPDRFVTAKRQP